MFLVPHSPNYKLSKDLSKAIKLLDALVSMYKQVLNHKRYILITTTKLIRSNNVSVYNRFVTII